MATPDWKAIAGLLPAKRVGDPGSERRLTQAEYEAMLDAQHRQITNLKAWIAIGICWVGGAFAMRIWRYALGEILVAVLLTVALFSIPYWIDRLSARRNCKL